MGRTALLSPVKFCSAQRWVRSPGFVAVINSMLANGNKDREEAQIMASKTVHADKVGGC